MKIINFTFLVLLSASLSRAACDNPNVKIQCASGPVCTSIKNYKCPEDVNTNYSNEGRGAVPASESSSSKATASAPTNSTKNKSGASSTKSIKSNPADKATKEAEPQQSTASISCDKDNEYPVGGVCLKCPGNQTITSGGNTYCGTAEGNKTDKDSSSEESANSNAESEQCIQQFVQMNEKCISEASSAMTSCNDNNEEMQAAGNAAKLIGAGSVTSIQVACSKIGELSKLANGAFAGWQTLCSANQGGCTESCTEAKRILQSQCIQEPNRSTYISSYLSSINSNIVQCESYKEKISQAAQHAAAALAQLKASEQCKNDSSSIVNNNVDQCKTNPNSPLCKDLQRCSDANFAAQNPVCACASNPTSPSCLQASGNYGNGPTLGSTLPGINGGKNGSGLPGLNGDGNGDGHSLSGLSTNSPSIDGHGVGGRQGDAGSAGNLKNSAAGGPGGSGNHNGAGGKDPLKVNSGILGGSPGVLGYLGRAPANGALGNNAINGSKGALAKFDPRKYISGLGGKGEFINGANQNIFMIVKMRYEDKKTSLLPETFNLKK